MNNVKFAAIDIGSNAIRLLIENVAEYEGKSYFKKVSLLRVPIRLGQDSFTKGRISESNKDRLTHALIGFSHLIKAHEVESHIACATSAMRDAANGQEIVSEIFDKSGINIHIIDGYKEADLIYSTQITNVLNPDKDYLYVDIGGGSTELTLFSKGEVINSHSFNIGTIRVLYDLVRHHEWEQMKAWVKEHTSSFKELEAIGSGGNINRLYKMTGKSNWKATSNLEIKKLYEMLSSYSYEERVTKLNLQTDRADVIIPASQIITSLMKWGRIKKLNVPKMGLADGLIRRMYSLYESGEKVRDESVLDFKKK